MASLHYKPLAFSESDVDEEFESVHTRPTTHEKRQRLKKLAFVLVAGATVMYLAFTGTRALVRAVAKPCVSSGHHRNLTTAGALPTHYTLPSGDKIPSVALGVWQASQGDVGPAVRAALTAGYAHIDGAWAYRNEAEVGQAVKDSGLSRDKLWLTSKLWNNFHAPEDVEAALDDTLAKLDTEYLDLYLIHWPVAFKKEGNNVLDVGLTADPYPTWKKLEEMVDKGKVRNIGISKVKNLTANPLKYKPAVNQVELNYFNPQPELLKWAKENDLLLEAYSPLGSTKQVKDTLALPVVQEIAKTLAITPAQVIISWHVQRGTVVLPKSVTPSRVEENLQGTFLPYETVVLYFLTVWRVVNPSKGWNIGFDVFDEEWPL
ncbi:hypothetical protein EUX98_g4815 [Antrodiella citrinella]|uniref:NADP-dependent oxidoreductase domain-containing protein n=1 Tax=Antrodiella citrinella TaxID=2447956 RepID=A0A4S4N103_9APHY|nr:hypothetical protein EUX98_g4815 [Antrodiella citrinella]